MRRIATLLTVVLVVPALAIAADPAIKVEFRRAEFNPAPGLTAAQVADSDNTIYLHSQAELTNADIAGAQAKPSENGKRYEIEVTMTDEGARKLKALTEQHLMKPLAILLDGKLWMAPRIVSPLGRKAMITGALDHREAERIASGIVGKKAS
jgi:preprotein translocase subunit SecD